MSRHGSKQRGLVRGGLAWLCASAVGYGLVVLACSSDPRIPGGPEDGGEEAGPNPSDAAIGSDAADAEEDVRIPRFKDGDCSSDSWCMVMLPQATRSIDNPYTIYGIWAAAANDVWAVGGAESRFEQGELAIVLHYDGTKWSIVYEKAGRTASPYSTHFTGIYAASPNDLWVSGDGPALHIMRDSGGALTFDTSDAPRGPDGGVDFGLSFGGRGPDDVWAVGKDIFRRVVGPDGGAATWKRVDVGIVEPNLRWEHIRAIPGDNRFAMVGFLDIQPEWGEDPDLGRLARFAGDGSGLVMTSFHQLIELWGPRPLSSVWVSGYEDIWHVRGDVRHLPRPRDAGADAGDPFEVDAGTKVQIYAVARSPQPDNHVWVGGQGGVVLVSDGTSFNRSSTSVGGVVVGGDIYTMFALSDKDVWAGGVNVLLHRRVP